MALPVAVQLFSVRDSVEADMAGALRQIKEMGYDGVEFAGLFGNSPEYVRGLCEGLGLVPISAHIPIDEMLSDPDKVFEAYKTIGCKYAVVPYVTEERRPGAEKFEQTLREIRMLGEIANRHGLTLLYHNHDFEFKKINDEYGIDVLYKEIPAEYLKTELDTCWVNVGGEEPSGFIRKYSGRVPVVHLKDFYISGKLPKHLYVLIGLNEDEKNDEPSTFEFRPAGHGMQNVPAILDASVESGAEWVVVEQDEPSMNLSRMESIKTSREYLRSIGW